MGKSKSNNKSRVVGNQALETLSTGRPRVVVDQATETSNTGLLMSTNTGTDTLVITNISQSLSYNSLHEKFKGFGTVLRIRLMYPEDTDSNKCYLTFNCHDAAKQALESVEEMNIGGKNSKAELIRSCNVVDAEDDYIPNAFAAESHSTPKERNIPTPRWFVAYYKNGRGNFIRASRYLEKEIGTIPRGNLKHYGKGVLVRAKDIVQGRMLLNASCSDDCMFEAIKPHRTFNVSKGSVFNRDLAEFSEEEILDMCPDTVQNVVKIKGKDTLILLTFYGATLPVNVKIGPLTLSVKPFTERPLLCFSCYEYNHTKKRCSNSPRCGNCSSVNKHPTAECEAAPFCFHCDQAHPLKSNQCPKYRLEQDILNLANTQFLSLGSARRELRFRQEREGKVKTYSSVVASKATQRDGRRPVQATPIVATVGKSTNRFSALAGLPVEAATEKRLSSPQRSCQQHVVTVEVHQRTTSPGSPKPQRKSRPKRTRDSTESIDSKDSTSPPSKIPTTGVEGLNKVAKALPPKESSSASEVSSTAATSAVVEMASTPPATAEVPRIAVAPAASRAPPSEEISAPPLEEKKPFQIVRHDGSKISHHAKGFEKGNAHPLQNPKGSLQEALPSESAKKELSIKDKCPQTAKTPAARAKAEPPSVKLRLGKPSQQQGKPPALLKEGLKNSGQKATTIVRLNRK